MITTATAALQNNLDQLEDRTIIAPGGPVNVVVRGSGGSFGGGYIELRGWRKDAEGNNRQVGPHVSISTPRLDGWGEKPGIQLAGVNHSSSSGAEDGDGPELAIALISLAIELRDRMNEEAEVALAPEIAEVEAKRAEYMVAAEKTKALRERQHQHVSHELGFYADLRVTLSTRKQPVVGKAGVDRMEIEGNKLQIGDKKYRFGHIEKIERREGQGKFGQFVDTGFPVDAS